jgi:transglutaminase/protease-like cytokinesis protein 3
MKSKISSFIMTIISLFIIAILIIFGMMFWEDFKDTEVGTQIQNFVSDVTSLADENSVQENIEEPQIIEGSLDALESSSSPSNTNQYSGVNINRHFYDQLEEPAKIIYRALEANKEEIKTGTHQINLGTTLSDVLSSEGGEEKLGYYYQSAIESYIYDNPEAFYLNVNKMYLNIETTTKRNKTTYNVFINQGKEANYLADGYYSKTDVDQAMGQIEQAKNQILAQKTGNTYKDIKMVHDYLVDHIEYDSSISADDIYNLYGALVRGKSVCEGYAKAFKYLMDQLDIPCVIVIGKGTNSSGKTENHAWNYVELNQTWYAIDSTWDDPVIIGGGKASSSSKVKYFLKGSSEFNRDHVPNGQFTEGGKVFSYPELSVRSYS